LKTKTKKLVERGLKKALLDPRTARATREAVRAYGQDNLVEAVRRCVDGEISWTRFHEAHLKMARRGLLREAVSETSFAALLRLGVENIIMKAWEVPETVWDQVIMNVPSTGAYGVYGSTFRQTFPQEVPAGGEFPSTKFLPDEKILRNKKFGAILPINRELFEDDQTGEINTKSSEMGEQMQQLKEIWFAGMVQAKAFTFGNVSVPAPVYKDVSTAGATLTSVYTTALGNRPATFTALTAQAFKTARTALLTMKDPLGNIVGGLPDTLLVSPDMEYVANLLMNSSWTPTNVGSTGTPTFPTDSNPIKGMARVKVCVYLPENFWALGRAKKRSLIMQTRTPLEVIQEDPASGKSFEEDQYRFRVRERWAMGWVLGGARHWYLGNDGTISQPSLTP
jgi:phage major head subunit gpT-like protein